MTEPLNIVADARFECSLCGAEAGTIRLSGQPSSAKVRRMSFTSDLVSVVPARQFDALCSAIRHQDAGKLCSLDLEYAPFYCPQCDAVYCAAHWTTLDVFDDDFPGWHDSIRGKCPEGHERKLED